MDEWILDPGTRKKRAGDGRQRRFYYYDEKVQRWRDSRTGRFVPSKGKGSVYVTFKLSYESSRHYSSSIEIDAYIQDRVRKGETPHEAAERLKEKLFEILAEEFREELASLLSLDDFKFEYDPYRRVSFDYTIEYRHRISENRWGRWRELE